MIEDFELGRITLVHKLITTEEGGTEDVVGVTCSGDADEHLMTAIGILEMGKLVVLDRASEPTDDA